MNILWNPNEAVDFIEMPLPLITEGTQDMGDGVYWLRAGTPLDEYFAVANDGDAKYVVAEDFYFISTKPEQAKVVQLITAGYVDINKAEAASGITYSQDCIDALADEGIVLVDGTLPSSGGGGGGGGGGVFLIGSTVQNEIVTLNKTLSEIFNAAKAGNFCVIYFDSEEIVSYMYVDFVDLGGYVYAIHYNPNGSSYLTFHADTPNDYPSAVMP